jgi:hypothetical protein
MTTYHVRQNGGSDANDGAGKVKAMIPAWARLPQGQGETLEVNGHIATIIYKRPSGWWWQVTWSGGGVASFEPTAADARRAALKQIDGHRWRRVGEELPKL